MRIDWELLLSYLAGTCTDAERAAFEQWLAESPEHREVLESVRRVGARAGREVPPARAAALTASLRREMAVGEPARAVLREASRRNRVPAFTPLVHARRSRWMTVARIAAVALVVVGAGVMTRTLMPSASQHGMAAAANATEIHTPRGQRLTFRLSDSTLVTLAPMSRLRLASDYGVRSRQVFLEGEAAFTVVHDTRRPFAVHTARAVASDLGTRFVVRAYTEDAATDVVVAEGRVAVGRTPGAADMLVLTRGELARLAPDGQWTHVRGVALDRYFGWTDGWLLFRDMQLREAVVRLSRWYDIDIQLASPDIGVRPLDASFKHESATEALTVVARALNLDIIQAGRTYTLRAK